MNADAQPPGANREPSAVNLHPSPAYDARMRIEQQGEDVLIWIKAVPGAARDAVAGAVGDRLKIRVSAPPEGGKANAAICRLLARALGRKPREMSVETGPRSAEKIIRIAQTDVETVRLALNQME